MYTHWGVEIYNFKDMITTIKHYISPQNTYILKTMTFCPHFYIPLIWFMVVFSPSADRPYSPSGKKMAKTGCPVFNHVIITAL